MENTNFALKYQMVVTPGTKVWWLLLNYVLSFYEFIDGKHQLCFKILSDGCYTWYKGVVAVVKLCTKL